jgi:hypothetical protein
VNKIQKIIKSINTTFWFSILLAAFIVVLFVILSPKVSSLVFPLKRQAILNEFISKTKTAGAINPQDYWQFREFYSPGYFTFSRTGIAGSSLATASTKIGVTYNRKAIDLIDLYFSSQKLDSLDMLTKQSNLSSVVNQKQFQNDKVIFMNNNSAIYQEDNKTIKIVFLLSNNDMQKANGFFDYTDKDKKITEGENWLNITSLSDN